MKTSVSEANSALEAKTEELGARDQVILETNTRLSGAKTKVDEVYSGMGSHTGIEKLLYIYC